MEFGTNKINLTANPITLRGNQLNKNAAPDPDDVIIEPSGITVSVSVKSEIVGDIDGFPVVKTVLGDPIDLPDPVPGTTYIASSLVAQKALQMGRTDVVAPNTAPGQDVRYPEGHPLKGRTFAVFGFQTF